MIFKRQMKALQPACLQNWHPFVFCFWRKMKDLKIESQLKKQELRIRQGAGRCCFLSGELLLNCLQEFSQGCLFCLQTNLLLCMLWQSSNLPGTAKRVLRDEMENPYSVSASWVCRAWFACAGFALWILDSFADFPLWTLLQPPFTV